MKIKITNLKTIPLVIKLENPIEFSTRFVDKREFTIVQIFTDIGLIGESCVPIGDPISVAAIIERKLKDLVIGQDPFDYEKIWDRMYREMYRDRKGSAIRAISAVDIALWDLKGKALEMPLYKLLGGYRSIVPCYASGGYYYKNKGLEGLAEEMSMYVDKGHWAMKMKIGAVSVKEDIERVKLARETIGPDRTLLIDANNSYDSYTAIKFGRVLEEIDAYFFEEPVHPENLLGSKKVAEALDIPIASGELEYTVFGFRELIEKGGVDIIQPDATVLGGITEWLKVAALATANGIPIAPHWEQEIHMHLVGALPNTLWVEYFHDEIGVRHEDKLYIETLKPIDGYLHIPDKAGLGTEFNPEAIKRYRID